MKQKYYLFLIIDNMIYVQVISGLFFLISIRSMMLHRNQNHDARIEASIGGKLILTTFSLLSFIMMTIIISKVGNLKWYFSTPISIFIVLIFSFPVTSIYNSIFGILSKPTLSYFTGRMERNNLYIIDALITFGIGFILFLIFCM